jgi:hypothetical protein
MDEATYQSMPDAMCVRETRVEIREPGFRTRQVVVVTTLIDREEYSPRDLAELYRMRWHAEVYQPECPSRARLYQPAA